MNRSNKPRQPEPEPRGCGRPCSSVEITVASAPVGEHLHFVLPPVSLDELVPLGTLHVQARGPQAAVVAGLNIILAGGAQAGKHDKS